MCSKKQSPGGEGGGLYCASLLGKPGEGSGCSWRVWERARRLYCSYIAGSLPPLGSSSSFFGATFVETAAAMVVAAAAATFFSLGHAKSRLFKQGEKAIEVSPACFGPGFARDFSSVSFSFPPVV